MSLHEFRYAPTDEINPDFDGDAFFRQWHRKVGTCARAGTDVPGRWSPGDLVLCYSDQCPNPDDLARLKAELEADPRNIGNVLARCDQRTREWDALVDADARRRAARKVPA